MSSTIARPELRKLINQLLVSDSDLDAFCVDHFPETFSRFAAGMDRSTKISALFVHEDLAKIAKCIMDNYPSKFTSELEKIKSSSTTLPIVMPTIPGSILVLTSKKHREFSGINTIADVATCEKRSVKLTHQAATVEQLVYQLGLGFSILHLETTVKSEFVEFDDQKLSAHQFQELLSVHHRTLRFVILSACQSFRIGKALEASMIRASVVATKTLRTDFATSFYMRFYGYLFQRMALPDAFFRSVSEENALHGQQAENVFMLSVYQHLEPLIFDW